jgi:uncharacterized membrane protein YdfJ with MMPL/SSD domain
MFVARKKWAVLGTWLVLVAGMLVVVHIFGSNTSNNLSLPGTDSQAASNLLTQRFPPQQNGNSPIVFYAKTGKVTDAKNKQAIQASYAAIKVPHVVVMLIVGASCALVVQRMVASRDWGKRRTTI